MCADKKRLPGTRTCRTQKVLGAAVAILLPSIATSQGLTGRLIGSVKDEQGGALAGARVTIMSPALIGGRATLVTSDNGQLRFPSLPPGLYVFEVELEGFAPGSHLLSSQTLFDVRLSRAIAFGNLGRIDLLLDVLKLLNDTAEESLATETLMTEMVLSPTFGQPVSFVDPRRAMISVRLNLGR